MTDLATIGFRAETKDLDKADKKLNKLSATGAKTEKKVNSLQDKFKSFGKNAAASVAAVDGPLGGISSRISSLTTVATAGGLAMTALAVGVTAATFAISRGVKELDKLEVSLAKTNALIKATGSAAGKTGDQLAEQAQEIAFATLASVEGISKAQGIMLTFKSISGDVFDDAIRLSQDMASVMGGDAATAALQFGKALNDPIKGMTSLSRAGIAFTQQQKDQVAAFTDSGEMLKAQSVILDEVKGQLEGVAEEIAGKTLSGSLDTMGQAFDNFTVRVASNIGALDTFKSFIDTLNEGIKGRTGELEPDSAVEAFQKALDLKWEILEVEEKLSNLKSSAILDRAQHREVIKNLNEERQIHLDRAKAASDADNKETEARTSAIEASILLQVENAKLAREAKAIADAKPFEKWKASIDGFQTPLQKLTAELEKVKSALSTGKLDFSGGAFEKIASLQVSINKLTLSTEELNEEAKDDSYQKWIDEITGSSQSSKLQKLQDEITEVWLAMDAGDISGAAGFEFIDQLEDRINGLSKTMSKMDLFGSVTDSIKESLAAVQDLSAQGSKDYAKLGVAIQAVNAVQAIGAVINQGFGDPYTAFARMAAMATTMVGLGQSVGSVGGSFTDSAAQNQADQGLNIWGEKSESILNSIETTANATEQLVGINTGMLKALQSLQAGISGAAGISARGIAGAEFDFVPKVVDKIFGSEFIGAIFGGSSKVTDQGIQIMGGTFADIIEGAAVFAFQETQSKKYVWSSTKTNEELFGLDEASKQFSLVFDSLASTVFEGGKALGFGTLELEKSISEFEIATTKISLKGLSVDDQQAEIEAVFSQIFDGLAGSVVPFINEFQLTGESLGETLARVATQVQIAEYAADALGFTLGDKLADPQLFAQISDNLAEMVGGIEQFASKTASFIDTFAPESVKFDLASSAINDALTDVGLRLPETAEAFFALMEGATPAQVAALLNAQDSAKDYYDLLEDRSSKATGELNAFNSSLSSLSSTLKNTVKSIYGISAASAKNSLDSAIQAARLGDFSKALNLDSGGFKLDQSNFSSISEFNLAQAGLANKLTELSELTGKQATTEDMMLTEAHKQTELLTSINSSYIPQQTADNKNVILLDEVKMLRAEIKRGNDNQEVAAKDAKQSADSLQRIEIGGIEVRA